ncbi:malto-oligosyltrehalose trehalohydrolase [Herbaspirillum sp. meg3]|uniref:malto-oligosyltrehalose trehalohydrolase n=1 Tax=Herbaspirillum sp. meg3 TaxID=2025949 RepID=UPI000B98A558|nr:malto-oligosyltrehalose trehalohydrolase [Herbaspirillum sp. meg3]ASU38822.1 malto-oligosyltrehalose trehalohydrolase [Herbaspirillum sp. meg3]
MNSLVPLHPNNVRFHYRLPFGAEYLGNGRTRFRIWAPLAKTAAVELDGRRRVPMSPSLSSAEDGWFEVETDCEALTQYHYVLMSQIDGEISVPDPASRCQAGDVHADSVVIDASAYEWQTVDWRGRPWHETVLYELHVGALGGFAGVTQRLQELAELGITAVELMPVSEFPGAYNWGYDGVLPYAPDASYGTPEQLKQLIDTAHGLGMMVFLDVVYNHFGPDGNYLASYSPFFRNDTNTPWGQSIDFHRPEVADFFAQNALYWLQEYRFDGLRLDAVHAIGDQSWLRTLAAKVRTAIALEDGEIGLGKRHVHLVLEHDGNAASLLNGGVADGSGGGTYEAQWNDDGHHVLHVLLTGETGGYYADYAIQPAEKLARCLREGFIYQGEPSPYRDNELRGESSVELPPTAFVLFLQNHDQIGNRARGERLTALADPAALRAAQALLLLSPQIPMLFMGEEYGAAQPFYYFTSHADEKLADAVRTGRRKEFSRFPEFADPAALDALPDPNSFSTFMASIPEPVAPEEDASAGQWMGWCYRLLLIRREAITPYLPGAIALDAQAIGPAAVYARWRLNNGTVLCITINLGNEAVTDSTDTTLDALATLAGADVLFDSGGVLDSLAGGVLPPHSILVIREAAR